jgi:glycine/D-amino acid oxidase-like deaminating enzyme
MQRYDAVVVGGGFYGCVVATHLAAFFDRVLVLEREPELLQRASYVNQARLHTGYHYPRSFRTAASSLKNRAIFEELYEECVDRSFRALYAIGRPGSKVSRSYFERFCRTLRLPLRPAPQELARMFSPKLIDGVYECEEYAFDAQVLRRVLKQRLTAAGVEVRVGTEVDGLSGSSRSGDSGALVSLAGQEPVEADWVFSCTYARLNTIAGLGQSGAPRLKHQVTEVCLVEVPEPLRHVGVTVMDGSFFSAMPFPARQAHSLTHVRYTPHFTWVEELGGEDPYRVLESHAKQSHYAWMLRDAQRYVPCLADTRYLDTLFEIKTVLVDTIVDDARPIVFHRDESNPRVISILGGKLDNIFDVLAVIDQELELTP